MEKAHPLCNERLLRDDGDMDHHLRIVGWIYTVLGGISLIAGCIFILFLYTGLTVLGPDTQTILKSAGLGTVLLGVLIVASVLSLITGIALLKGKGWGRVIAMVMAIIGLLDIPFGTALGIYTLWVLRRTRKRSS